MRALGFDVHKAEVLKVLKEYDNEGTAKITFDNFNEVSKSFSISHWTCGFATSV